MDNNDELDAGKGHDLQKVKVILGNFMVRCFKDIRGSL